MPRSKAIAPSYRYHVSGQAVVTFCGKNFYLGEYDSPQSWAKYHALVGEYIGSGRTEPPSADSHQAEQKVTVRCVTAEFRQYVKKRYADNPKETNRFDNLCDLLDSECGTLPAEEFGPRKLSDLRELLVTSGNNRSYVNRQTKNIVKIFRHAVSRELIGPERIIALDSLEPLKYGQTKAAEPIPVEAIDLDAVRATAAHLSPVLKAMIRIQAATGMRSGEIVTICPEDIDKTADDVWVYSPRSHKTSYRGKIKQVPLVGDAKLAIGPFLNREASMFCFSAKESAQWYRDQRTAKRKTPDGPGRNKPGTNKKANPKRQPRDRFDTGSYRKAIQRAQTKAGVERWTPHQLRHTAAGIIRDALGIENAQALLGHSHKSMTEHYAKQSLKLAIEAAQAGPTL